MAYVQFGEPFTYFYLFLIGAVPQIVTRWYHNITLTITLKLSLT